MSNTKRPALPSVYPAYLATSKLARVVGQFGRVDAEDGESGSGSDNEEEDEDQTNQEGWGVEARFVPPAELVVDTVKDLYHILQLLRKTGI
jgi:hypothetical protein